MGSARASKTRYSIRERIYAAMRQMALFFFAIAALSSHETFARDRDGYSGHRRSPVHRTTAHTAPPFIPFGSYVGPVTGCYGFDHGPFYSPYSCILPYPCEYYGTSKRHGFPYRGYMNCSRNTASCSRWKIFSL